ncbi:MAG: maleylpyruvate isomerase family mycothiol-dependent enzyme [Frankiaceae bacterium]|nr:maleylpyruvate isomerase family mycothiol-dependent enzyme [Frankiaceae bacterium]
MTYDAIATIRREADAFLTAARRGLEPTVPGCPDWTVRELTQHLGSVHRFHARHIVRGVTDPPEKYAAELPPDEDLLAWFDEGVDDLLITFRGIDMDSPAWNWAPHTPQLGSFWPRRMTLETAVHRWDAESAHHDATGFDVDVAVDGIDEMLTVMGPTDPEPDIPSGTAVVRATDADREWAIRLGPGSFDVRPAAPPAPDAVVEGTSSSLLLALWGRIPASDLATTGDASLIAYLTS